MNNIHINQTSLYIHIPFCQSICSYCDFYKMIAKSNVKDKYIDYLIKELKLKQSLLKNLKTIYIGGGTPTSLSLLQLEKLLSHIDNYIDNNLIEYTIEANPHDLTLDMCNLLKKHHINRVSMGLQATTLSKLQLLNRNHTFIDAKNACDNLIKAGITNINIDYMYAIEGDSIKSINEELDLILTLPITHISSYSLILEEHTILYNKYKNNTFKLIDEDLESQMYYFICDKLINSGFEHYEISNFSLKNHRSHHNIVYWKNLPYVAVGANSSGYLIKNDIHIRYTNINNLSKYYNYIDNYIDISNYNDNINNCNLYEYNKLETLDILDNYIMLGLRIKDGISLTQIKTYLDEKRYNDFIKEVTYLYNNNLIIYVSENTIAINPNKYYISNSIILRLLDSYKD